MTPEQTARMVELLPTIESMRELADVLGVSRGCIHRAAAPFLAIMKLNGTHPKCECGQDRFHRSGCEYTYNLSRKSRGDRIPGRTAIRSEAPASALQSHMRISYAVFCMKKKKTN